VASGPSGLITRPPAELLGHQPGYGFAGLEVRTAIGNFTQTAQDISFPAGLLGLLDWRRTYNSRSESVGVLGPGWATTFSAGLLPPAHGSLYRGGPVIFYHEDGRVLTFAQAGGGFTRPQDLDADLSVATDGSFTLACHRGLTWTFDATGRSLAGQRVSFDYDSDGLLLRARHSGGRYLTFCYDDRSRRLTAVEASDGRTVTVGYSAGDATSALLKSVTSSGGGVTNFESTGSGHASRISRITDPDGRLIVANTYNDLMRRVTGQELPGDGWVTFQYDDDAALTTVTSHPGAATVTFQADQQGRLAVLTDPAGQVATFSYDGAGQLTEAVTPGGTRLSQTYDGGGNLRSSTFGGSTTTWTYDDEGRGTSVTDPRATGGALARSPTSWPSGRSRKSTTASGSIPGA
jgi:YD repeat-containing protein